MTLQVDRYDPPKGSSSKRSPGAGTFEIHP
jgi:hypothetical protein